MDSRLVKSEISILKFYQIFHFILIILIVICHFISVNKYFLIFKSLIIIFYLSMSIYFLNAIFLFISTIFMFTKKSKPTLFNLFKKISFKLVILSVVKGFTLSIVFWINYYYYLNFIPECPFNFSIKDIDKLMKNTNDENYSKNCNLKRCIFYSQSNENNLSKYNYICNFDSEYENKDQINNNELDCHYMNYLDYSESKFYSYLEKCYEYDNYYLCSSNIKKHDKFFIKYNQKCPKKIRKQRTIILGILFAFIDIIADLVIWLFIYFQYKRIIRFINFETLLSVRRLSPSSLNSTKDSSIIKPDNDNKDIINQININQPEILIYPPININDNKTKIKIINNMSNKIKIMDEKKENILILDQNSANSRCEFITTNHNNNL